VKLLEQFFALGDFCVALPKIFNRDLTDARTARLAAEGITEEDVALLRAYARELDAAGYASMTPYFGFCSEKDLMLTNQSHSTCEDDTCGAHLDRYDPFRREFDK
jgi:hypothetical protein